MSKNSKGGGGKSGPSGVGGGGGGGGGSGSGSGGGKGGKGGNNPSGSGNKDIPSLNDIVVDLSSRFVANAPTDELASWERLFFQLEQAQWFYIDQYCKKYPSLPQFDLKSFCKKFFQLSPLLRKHHNKFEEVFSKFRHYLGKVPVAGCVLMNQRLDKVLCVKGIAGSWGFPRGKLNQNETEVQCAVREVIEEVGYDASPLLNEEHVIKLSRKGKRVSLYIIRGVNENAKFKIQNEYEIKEIRWFSVFKLPVCNGITPYLHQLNLHLMSEGVQCLDDIPDVEDTRQDHREYNDFNDNGAGSERRDSKSRGGGCGGDGRHDSRSCGGGRGGSAEEAYWGGSGGGGDQGSKFDQRNGDTFGPSNTFDGAGAATTQNKSNQGGTSDEGWSVEAMFAENAQKFGVENDFEKAAREFEEMYGASIFDGKRDNDGRDVRRGNDRRGGRGGGGGGGRGGSRRGSNMDTFGQDGGWSVEEMLKHTLGNAGHEEKEGEREREGGRGGGGRGRGGGRPGADRDTFGEDTQGWSVEEMLQRTLGAPAQEESERKKGIKSTQSFSNDVIFKQIEEQQKIQQQAQQRPPLSQDSVTILQRLKPDDDVSNKFQMLGLSIGGAVENTALSSPFHATQAPPATSNHQPATSPLAALPPPLSQQNETLLKELQQLQLQHYTQSAFFHAHAHGPSAYAPRLPQGVDLLMNGFPPTGMNVHQFVPSQQVHGQTGMLGHHPNGFGLHLPMPNPTTLPLTYQNSAQSAHFQQLLQAQTAALQSQKASSVKQAMKASLLAKK